MTTPAGPRPVDVGRKFPPRAGAPAAGPELVHRNPLAVLGTRNGQLGAAVVGVVGIALWHRYRTAKQAAQNPGIDPATGQPYATQYNPGQGTSATDLYNALEPLAEHLSGYSDAATLAQIQATLAAIQKGAKPPVAPPPKPGPGPVPNPNGYANQLRTFGKAGQRLSLTDYLKQVFPGATTQQYRNAAFYAVLDPRNAKYKADLQKAVLPGGVGIYFDAPTIGR